jgi:hypothetical protein
MAGKFALIIGNSQYDDPNLGRLKAPDQDVLGLEEVLKAPEIGQFDEVTTLLNEGAASVRKAIALFYERRQREDLLLLYFSGHGVKDEQGHLYLALRDTETGLLAGTAIEAAFISGRMDRSLSKRQVLVLDCCHSGAFAGGAKAAQGVSVGTAEAFEGTGLGRVILTATDATQYAWEGDRVIGDADRSLFTHFLVDGLKTGTADRDEDGAVTVDELYDYVHEQVVNASPRQTPRKWSYRQKGDVVIAQNPFTKRCALPPEIEEAKNSKLSSLRLEAVRDLETLLRGRHSGRRQAALNALKELALDDSRKVANAAIQALKACEQEQPATSQSAVVEAPPALQTPQTGAATASSAQPQGVASGVGARAEQRLSTPPATSDKRVEVVPSDIFISYEHNDRAKAKALANALTAQGWTVWWDRRIAPGEAFDLVIERELATCRCVIVLWTARSVGATWVRNEARRAAKRRVLVPLLMEPVEPPLEFENLQAADLTTWDANKEHPDFEAVLDRIQALAPSAQRLARVAVEHARREFLAGRTREALATLEQFQPTSALVSQTLTDLSAEAERIAGARAETVRQESEAATQKQQLAAAAEAERIEHERREAARHETARQEAARQEAARQETARLEAAQREAEAATRPMEQRVEPAGSTASPWQSLIKSRAVQLASVGVLMLALAVWWASGKRTPQAGGATEPSVKPQPAATVSEPAALAPTPVPIPTPASPTTLVVTPDPVAPTEKVSPLLSSTRIERFPLLPGAVRENPPSVNEPVERAVETPTAPSNVEELRARALRQRQAGQHAQALGTVVEGLRLHPKDDGLGSILTSMLRDAQAAAARSKREAANLEASDRAGDAFGLGLQKEREAEKLRQSGRIDGAIRTLWVAADQFKAAAAQARQVADEEAAEQARIDKNNKVNAGVGQQPRQPEGPGPQANLKPVDNAVEQALVEKVLRRYEAAYASLSIDAVRSVFPAAPIEQLERDFVRYRLNGITYRLTIKVAEFRFYAANPFPLAVVPATVFHQILPKSGNPSRFDQAQTFQLEKHGDTWIIQQVR